MLTNIENIVFDIGRVLVSFEPLEYLNKNYEPQIAEFLFKEVFSSKEWLELDRGTLTDEQAIDKINKRTNHMKEYKEYVEEIIKGFSVILTPISSSVEAVKLLKEREFKLYLLSNFHKNAFIDIVKKNKFFNFFDGRVISSDHKLLKPEKEIYELLLRKFDLNPENTLFIDDTLRNIEVAKKLGFKTIHFQKNSNLYELFSEK